MKQKSVPIYGQIFLFFNIHNHYIVWTKYSYFENYSFEIFLA